MGRLVVRNVTRAAELYQLAADPGHARVQCSLGFCYEDGVDAMKNEAKAAELYQLAADQDHAVAQSFLGFCFQDGSVFPRLLLSGRRSVPSAYAIRTGS